MNHIAAEHAVTQTMADPVAVFAEFDAVIASCDHALYPAAANAEMAASTLAAQRCVRQGLTSAKANLLTAFNTDQPAVRKALAELARLQIVQLSANLMRYSHIGVTYEESFYYSVWSLAGLAVNVSLSALLAE